MMPAARPAKHLVGAAWLAYVNQALNNANIVPEVLASGALKLCNGTTRIITTELRHIDARDLSDLLAGRASR
jgi:hypothetical protein